MKSSLRLGTRQQLAFTPQIRHTIRMLQLGTRELGEEIDQVLATNPLLQDTTPAKVKPGDDSSHEQWLQNQPDPQSLTLESHLISQLGLSRLDGKLYPLACLVVSRLEDDGYLRISRAQLLKACEQEGIDASASSLESAIRVVQSLEPAGIASTSLAQCLAQQLERRFPESPARQLALSLCRHLDKLASSPNQLRVKLGCSEEQFEQARRLIRSLEPAPGRLLDAARTQFIQPDILLSGSGDTLSINLNPAICRTIDLNEYYIDLLKSSGKAPDRVYLRQNLDQARWWLNALAQRNRTLLDVASHMVHHQAEFFHYGDAALKPLKQQDIATALGIHVSTVSRAIHHKFIQGSGSALPLGKLLAGSVHRNNMAPLSDQAVKVMMAEIIQNESSQTPLSDAKIVDRLMKRGINISRRTITKYREQLKIPSSTRRKHPRH